MKKILLGFAMLAAGCLFAQPEANAQAVSIGPRLGINFSTLAYTDGDERYITHINEYKTSLNGIHSGLAAKFAVSDVFSVQPELLFSQKGIKIKNDDYETSTTMNYIEVPVLAKLSFGSDNFK